jgi:hypothetical protein
MVRVRVGHGMADQNCCVVGGCLLSLSLCRKGFQNLLKVRLSSLFILCGCISSSNYPEENIQQLNMFRASLCTSSGAYQLQQQPLVYRRNVVVAVLLFVVGPDRPRTTALLPPRSYGKPEAAAAVDRLLMMCIRMPEAC